MDLIEIDNKIISDAVVEKTWQIPAHGGKGPVTITLRMPEVRVADAEGRHIVISPGQADLVSAQLGDVVGWMEEAPGSEAGERGGD